MSGLVAVAGRPDRGRSCSSVSPLPEALTLWTQCPTVLLLTAQLPYTGYNRLWMFPTFSFSPLRLQLPLVVCNVCQTQTPFTQTTTAALSVGQPCTYIHVRNKHQCCYLSIFTLLSLFWNEKKNVGHSFLSNPRTLMLWERHNIWYLQDTEGENGFQERISLNWQSVHSAAIKQFTRVRGERTTSKEEPVPTFASATHSVSVTNTYSRHKKTHKFTW